MLRSIKQLIGNALGASDGEIGHVKDFYFDDQKWAIRYVVVETGTWLAGRAVLISPHAFGRFHQAEKVLRIRLTRKQIENGPSIDAHKPVSRQYEEEYHRYYGWPYYWQGDALGNEQCSHDGIASGFCTCRLSPCQRPATVPVRSAFAQHERCQWLPYQGERWNERPCLRLYDG